MSPKTKGHVFKKSSFSAGISEEIRCVGVSITDKNVFVKNIASGGHVIDFTRPEWDAFIKGVKNGEFDLKD